MIHTKWKFDNTYIRLHEKMFSCQLPETVADPLLILWNEEVATLLNLDFAEVDEVTKAQIFSGNVIVEGMQPIAQAYAGHQFGHFTMLGDGRAILLAEQINAHQQRYDIQLKGSGKTPYSRRGDGKATLYAMLREYLISEAMHALHIPTSRSLAVVATGEKVFREAVHDGAVLTRIAQSHIRVGTFEYVKHFLGTADIESFTDYVINRHYPELQNHPHKALALLEAVMDKQIELIANWMRVGFIHGVMNTDNMSIAGETIDYGPCAFMNTYNPATVFSSIDTHGRYAFGNQPAIAQWNIACFAGALLPLVDSNQEKAMNQVRTVLSSFVKKYEVKWLSILCGKLGLENMIASDIDLINQLLKWMQDQQADYTYTFALLRLQQLPENTIYNTPDFIQWYNQWQSRVVKNSNGMQQAQEIMSQNNPFYIPRNYWVEAALTAAAHDKNFQPLQQLLDVLKNPYTYQESAKAYTIEPQTNQDQDYQTYCGT